MEYNEDVQYLINFTPIAVIANTSAQTVNIVVFIVSWVYILPVYWKEGGWSTFDEVYTQIR